MAYKKMNPAVKKMWLNSLRSGRFNQTKSRLKNESGYCCLGVLAETCGYEFKSHSTELLKPVLPLPTNYFLDGAGNYLTSRILAVVGLNNRSQLKLAKMNDGEDGYPKDFLEIANWIEKNL